MDQNELSNRLIGGLGAWTEGTGPLYQRLAAALRASIAQGMIVPGTRLPAERSLAERIHVSRGTVVAAYGLLQEEGVVDRRQGSGTVVRAPARPRVEDVPPKAPLLANLVMGPEPPIDLSLAAPPSTELPLDHTISLQDIAAVSPLLGYAPMGLPGLREQIAERFTAEGFETSPEQILITTGAQQAISLIAQLELAAGDYVALETPTYPGVIEAFARAGGGSRRSRSITAARAPTRCAACSSAIPCACCTSPRRVRTQPGASCPSGGAWSCSHSPASTTSACSKTP